MRRGEGGEEEKVFVSARRKKLLEAQEKIWEGDAEEETASESETESETEIQSETESESETEIRSETESEGEEEEEDTEEEEEEEEREILEGEGTDWNVGEKKAEREEIRKSQDEGIVQEYEKVTEVVVAVKELRREEQIAEGRQDRKEENKEEIGAGVGGGGGGGGGGGHQIDCFMRELQIMSSLSHPNVLKLYGFSRHPLQV